MRIHFIIHVYVYSGCINEYFDSILYALMYYVQHIQQALKIHSYNRLYLPHFNILHGCKRSSVNHVLSHCEIHAEVYLTFHLGRVRKKYVAQK
jgi:hypothetical protein